MPQDTDHNRAFGSGFPAELMIWLSPAFPVGGFAYSQGLETAVAHGWVDGRKTLEDWLSALVRCGPLRNDLIVIARVLDAPNDNALVAISELSAALQPSAERAQEACDLGQSFLTAYRSAWGSGSLQDEDGQDVTAITLPVAYGLAAREYTIEMSATLEGYAVSYMSNLLSAAIRLGVIGQYDGQRILAAILPTIRAGCGAARTANLEELGSATFRVDLASMLHETQETRLFRS